MQDNDLLRVIMTSIRAGRIEDAIADLALLDGHDVRWLASKVRYALRGGNSRLALSLLDRGIDMACFPKG